MPFTVVDVIAVIFFHNGGKLKIEYIFKIWLWLSSSETFQRRTCPSVTTHLSSLMFFVASLLFVAFKLLHTNLFIAWLFVYQGVRLQPLPQKSKSSAN
jgi:hypothetical protein